MQLIENRYDPRDWTVVTIDATAAPYGADRTGLHDASGAINRAIEDCQTKRGGGVVFLPAGTYRIEQPLTVLSAVTLKGEHAAPEEADGDYGTVLNILTPPDVVAVEVAGAAALSGLTFYYPAQSLDEPIPYTWTVRAQRVGFVLESLTFLNSYDGVLMGLGSSMGLATVRDVAGTALHIGMRADTMSEVSVFERVRFSPYYWASAGAAFRAPEVNALYAWMAEHSHAGFWLGGAEGPTFLDCLFDGYDIGLYLGETERRYAEGFVHSYAQFCRLRLEHARLACYVKFAYWDMGQEFAECVFQGEEAAVVNDSPYGVKLFRCQIDGKIRGDVHQTPDDPAIVLPPTRFRAPVPARRALYVASDYGAVPGATQEGAPDSAPALQAALDDAGRAGGGLVFVPGGVYALKSPLRVPAGVELRGANPLLSPEAKGVDYAGTVFFCYYGRGLTEDDPALITLAGEGAGLTGARFYYPTNGVTRHGDTVNNRPALYAPTVRGIGEHCYCRYLNFYASYYGIEMQGLDRFLIDRCVGAYYGWGIRIRDCRGGYVTSCLNNEGQQIHPPFAEKPTTYPEFSDWISNQTGDGRDLWNFLFEGLSMKQLSFLRYENATGQSLVSTFAYRPCHLISATNSEINAVNLYSSYTPNDQYVLNGGRFTLVNNHLKASHVVKAENSAQVTVLNILGQILPEDQTTDDIRLA